MIIMSIGLIKRRIKMCNFIKIEDKKDNGIESNTDDWYQPDVCPGCKMHFSMCECRSERTVSGEVDICGPDYPPC